eukprot:8801618-Pyramimonas_sp.AAC.1
MTSPTPTFPRERPRPAVETPGGPAEVFDERDVVFHRLLPPQRGAARGGVSRERGQTWRLRLAPRAGRQPRERGCCTQGCT